MREAIVMRPTLKLGTIAGIPIGVHWSVIGIMVVVTDVLAAVVLPDVAAGHSALAYWVTGVIAAISLLASIAVHEVAHAVVAKRNRVAVDRITLWLLGGVSALREEPPTPQAELRVAIAGPIASMAVALTAGAATVIAGALSAPDLAVAASFWLAMTNGILALFNLLPGAPLDGGRVLRAVLWRRYGDRTRAT
jgi:Zn-dependent protease